MHSTHHFTITIEGKKKSPANILKLLFGSYIRLLSSSPSHEFARIRGLKELLLKEIHVSVRIASAPQTGTPICIASIPQRPQSSINGSLKLVHHLEPARKKQRTQMADGPVAFAVVS